MVLLQAERGELAGGQGLGERHDASIANVVRLEVETAHRRMLAEARGKELYASVAQVVVAEVEGAEVGQQGRQRLDALVAQVGGFQREHLEQRRAGDGPHPLQRKAGAGGVEA
jgi:hypothetical protein